MIVVTPHLGDAAYLKQRAAECYESLARGFLKAGRALRSWLEPSERYWLLSP